MKIDFTGRDIRVGDTVAYAWRRGSQLALKRAVVLAIEDTTDGPVIVGFDPRSIAQRRVRIKNLANCVVIGR